MKEKKFDGIDHVPALFSSLFTLLGGRRLAQFWDRETIEEKQLKEKKKKAHKFCIVLAGLWEEE